jgi:hypothetical protein
MSDEAPATGTPAVPPATPPPYAVFPDAESFQKRVEREARKALKELGVEDPAAIKSALQEYETLKAAAEESRRAQMSEVERLRADLAAREAQAQEAMSVAEEAKLRAHLYQVFSKKGITNHDYGFWLITNKLASLPDDAEPLDEEVFLEEYAKDPAMRAALGMATPVQEAPAPQMGVRPATTSPVTSPAPQPPGANPAIPAKSAMDMTGAEWVQYKQRMGLNT